tara:strand:+ start:1458 stop:1598 length:141 start_codon:yes stop_codon:yes gene_type:complete
MKLSEQLTELIKQMEESDRRLKRLTDEHISESTRLLNLMDEVLKDE